MPASCARAVLEISQHGLTTPVQQEKRGRTALVKADRRATKFNRMWGSAERGTGLDRGAGEFLAVGPRDHGARLMALSSLALGISVRLQCAPASHQRGFKTGSKMRLFLLNRLISSHLVSSTPAYLERAKRWSAGEASHDVAKSTAHAFWLGATRRSSCSNRWCFSKCIEPCARPLSGTCGGTFRTWDGGMPGVPLTLVGKGRASNIQNEMGLQRSTEDGGRRRGGGRRHADVVVERAAERHGGRFDAEHRNEGRVAQRQLRPPSVQGRLEGCPARRGRAATLFTDREVGRNRQAKA